MTQVKPADILIAFSLGALFLVFAMALQVSPSVMTQSLMTDFKINALTLGLLSSTFYYTYTIVQVPAGLLLDRYNMVTLVSIALGLCILACLCFLNATQITGVLLARLLMGLGAALAFLTVLTLISRCFSRKRYALAVGLTQLLVASGGVIGEFPLGAAVNDGGWHGALWILVCMGALLLIAWLVLGQRLQVLQPKRLSQQSFWIDLLTVVTNKQLVLIAGYAFFCWVPITAFASLWGVPFFMANYDLSTAQAALLCALVWLGVGVGSPVIGWLSDRKLQRRYWMMLSAALGYIVLLFILHVQQLPLWSLLILLFLLGAASSGQALSFVLVQESVPERLCATASGFNNMAVVASGAVFQPLVGALLNWHATNIAYSAADFKFALSVLIIAYALCFIISSCYIQETQTDDLTLETGEASVN